MLLTLDIGNTNIKSALFVNDQIKDFTVHHSTENISEYLNQITFKHIAICSVNPAIQKIIYTKISEKGLRLFQANIQQKLNLKINYETPSSLGMDRVCSAVGALEIAEKDKLISEDQYLITIDFGTATTINIVSPTKEFIGGLIAPGITTMLKSLNERTAQLPLPDLNNYKGLIGDSTDSSIISGVITSTIGMIGETIIHLSNTSDQIIPIIFATGGNAGYILPHLKYKVLFEEALVSKGLKVIYDLNK
jgi:type III pantothenate kinase